jgi:hypothetical protein
MHESDFCECDESVRRRVVSLRAKGIMPIANDANVNANAPSWLR